jgi:hypothetical protein
VQRPSKPDSATIFMLMVALFSKIALTRKV